MKKLIVPVLLAVLVLSACKSTQLVSYADDIYAAPAEEKRLAQAARAEQLRKEAEEKRKAEEERLAQKAKDDANPYYKDPVYTSDDYYDYQYASRIKRFHNPVQGAGYYDNYYTNSYYYNNDPFCYGNSIYASYNWNMPSGQFNTMSYGMGYGNPYYYGNGMCWNSGYNNYWNAYNAGFNQGYYNGLYGYPYQYGYGSNLGWNNPGWGYFNSFDVNSGYSKMSYGPRGSSGGSNSGRSSYAGMAIPAGLENAERRAFLETVAKKQEESPRFIEIPRQKMEPQSRQSAVSQPAGIGSTSRGNEMQSIPTNENPANSNSGRNNNGIFNGNTVNSGTGKGSPVEIKAEPASPRKNRQSSVIGIENNKDAADQSYNQNRGWNGGSGNSGGNSGGNSSPRNSGAGTPRPR